jgi:hypothetical protein
MSGGPEVVNGTKGQGSEGATWMKDATGDGGSSEMNGGEKTGSIEPDFVITRETPNQQSKN